MSNIKDKLKEYLNLSVNALSHRETWGALSAILAVLLMWRGWVELSGVLVSITALLLGWRVNDPNKKLLDKVIKMLGKM